MKYNLDIRKSKAWQQLRQEGVDAGRAQWKAEAEAEYLRELIQKWTAKGMTKKEIAELLDISVAQVRKLMKRHPR